MWFPIIAIGFMDGFIELMPAPDSTWTTNLADVELMQFTGLKDRHGKDIYEGDILDGHSDGLVKVVWRGTGWECDFDDEGNIGLDEMCLWFGGNKTVDVIRNIYENPDLVSPAPDSNSDEGKGDEIVNEQAASMA